MPWTPTDAKRHDKKAASGVKARQWSDVANSILQKTGDEGRAVREANGVVKDRRAKMKEEISHYRGESAEYSPSRPKRKILRRHV
jgi:hypothetical protein